MLKKLQAKKAARDLEKAKTELIPTFKKLLTQFYESISTGTYRKTDLSKIYLIFETNIKILNENDDISNILLEEYAKFSTAITTLINRHNELNINKADSITKNTLKLYTIFMTINSCIIRGIRLCNLNLNNNLIRSSYSTILCEQVQVYKYLGNLYYDFLVDSNWNFLLPGMAVTFLHHLACVKQEVITKNALILVEPNKNDRHILSIELGKDLLYYKELEFFAVSRFPEYTQLYNLLPPIVLSQLEDFCKTTETKLFSGKETLSPETSQEYYSIVSPFIIYLEQSQYIFLSGITNPTEIHANILIDKPVLAQKTKIIALKDKSEALLKTKEPNINEFKTLSKECLLVLKDPAIHANLKFFEDALQTLEEYTGLIQKRIDEYTSFEHYTKLLEEEKPSTELVSKTSKTNNPRYSSKKETVSTTDLEILEINPTIKPLIFSPKRNIKTDTIAQKFYLKSVRYYNTSKANKEKAIALAHQALEASENDTMRAASLFLLSDLYFSSYDCKFKNIEQLDLLEKSLESCLQATNNYEKLNSNIEGIPDFSPDALLTWAEIRKEALLTAIESISRFIIRKETDREAAIALLGERWKKGSSAKPSERTLAYRAAIKLKKPLEQLECKHTILKDRLITLQSRKSLSHKSVLT